MQTRNIFLTFSLVIILAVAVKALVMNSIPDAQDVPLATSQEAGLQDGSSLIDSHCAQCHTIQRLKQTKKTRTGWENTLAKMERIGVSLSDTEKVVLLDYLTGIAEP